MLVRPIFPVAQHQFKTREAVKIIEGVYVLRFIGFDDYFVVVLNFSLSSLAEQQQKR